MTFETPMLFAIAFVILFTIGGFSGLMLVDSASGLPVSRYVLCGSALPLRASSRLHLLDYGGGLLLAA